MYNLALSAYDNLFSANHRSQMVRQHGYTQGMTVTLEDFEDDYEKRIKPLAKTMNDTPELIHIDGKCEGCDIISEILNN